MLRKEYPGISFMRHKHKIRTRIPLSSRALLGVVYTNSVASFCSSAKHHCFGTKTLFLRSFHPEPSKHEAAGAAARISPLIINKDQLWWMPSGSHCSHQFAPILLDSLSPVKSLPFAKDIHLAGSSWHSWHRLSTTETWGPGERSHRCQGTARGTLLQPSCLRMFRCPSTLQQPGMYFGSGLPVPCVRLTSDWYDPTFQHNKYQIPIQARGWSNSPRSFAKLFESECFRSKSLEVHRKFTLSCQTATVFKWGWSNPGVRETYPEISHDSLSRSRPNAKQEGEKPRCSLKGHNQRKQFHRKLHRFYQC